MKASILISRQKMYPCKNSPWIEMLLKAVQWVKCEDITLLTSIGTPSWDAIAFCAKFNNVKQNIYILSEDIISYEKQKKYYTIQFENTDNISFIPLYVNDITNHNFCFAFRDENIVNDSDILIPISIRHNGNLSYRINSSLGKKINNSFSVKYDNSKKCNHNYIDRKIFINEITQREDYIYHWTRSSKYNWPNETILNYYYDIFNSEFYPRNGYYTLLHILKEKKLIASNRHMPLDYNCVSFTSASISNFAKYMQWRKRYKEFSFEPYGIGIEKTTAVSLGIEKVKYLSEKEIKNIDNSSRWKFQSKGKFTDWSREEEYRYNQDFLLSSVSPGKMICICASKEEADQIEIKFNIRSYSIFL